MDKIIRLTFPIASIFLLFWFEQGLTFSYLEKTILKIALFVFIPLMLFTQTTTSFLKFRKVDSNSVKMVIFAGIFMMTIVMIAFMFLHKYIDIDALLLDLEGAGVTKTIFPFIALYILFGNSLIEEIFFRGLLPSFIEHPKLRLLVPSLLFALYHIVIFLPWFSPPLFVLAILGLWFAGFIFQLVNKQQTILLSWIIHMFADIGVLLVGVYIFYIY
ncbi:CPBP family glutamic-type intramembrane protease [Sporosarcina sp. FA9]|uniref:CPBP family glutamic-type intramembrane protease n=1 Tax=Sporosarcina sp. FA9 TaxID=3413030 RepID=UPI003F6585A1